MLSFVFAAFGLSTLWLIPLLWRLTAALVRRRRPPTVGPGAIRFWTGFVLVLLFIFRGQLGLGGKTTNINVPNSIDVNVNHG